MAPSGCGAARVHNNAFDSTRAEHDTGYPIAAARAAEEDRFSVALDIHMLRPFRLECKPHPTARVFIIGCRAVLFRCRCNPALRKLVVSNGAGRKRAPMPNEHIL